MQTIKKFQELSPEAYYDVIACGDENSFEAVYYLLTRRLGKRLRDVYVLHGFGLSDDYEDTIDDFFLYLHDCYQDRTKRPFSVLRNIQNKKAFFGWVISTYRNFLLNKAKEEARKRELVNQARMALEADGNALSKEHMILFLASAIAYADQHQEPEKRFILYRMLLSFLSHSNAIPQEAVAKTLAMHPVTYRVSTKRQKDRLMEFILRQESGENLVLDEKHLLMRDRIVECFHQLYELLLEYYNQSLEQLPAASDIQSLRREYAHHTGMAMHEETTYGFRENADVMAFYEALKSYVTSSRKRP